MSDICYMKTQDVNSYHEEPTTGAKVSMRDAKQVLETFCYVCAEAALKYQKFKKANGSNFEFYNSSTESSSQAANANALLTKPIYEIFEENKGDIKYYFCVLKMPECCKDKLKKVNPKNAYMKKRCAENHVALKAIIKLR